MVKKMNSSKVELNNYYFSGLESSQIGALKSVLNYYNMPVSSSWVYGMTGMAFLIVHDLHFKKPNAGPPEPHLFKLARNIGLNIEGVHTYAEDEVFIELQKKLWNQAREAIDKGYPVFAKNLDIENQTSIVYGYDKAGYYTHSWHGGNGHENADDVIPWDRLGQSFCPCRYCVKNREASNYQVESKGLISLHWAYPAHSEKNTFLEHVIELNEQGVIHWHNDKYFVGRQAYKEWISALEQNRIAKYHFSLTLEPIADARKHTVHFLHEMKASANGQLSLLIDEALEIYQRIATIYKFFAQKYPYEQPRESLNDVDRYECVELLNELMILEEQGLEILKRMYRED